VHVRELKQGKACTAADIEASDTAVDFQVIE
jgi:hypothetical protein